MEKGRGGEGLICAIPDRLKYDDACNLQDCSGGMIIKKFKKGCPYRDGQFFPPKREQDFG
ncbi:unnamed protein product, partial [Dovyalis caffra]